MHLAPAWSGRVQEKKGRSQGIVKYQKPVGSLRTLLKRQLWPHTEVSVLEVADGDVTQQARIWCSCTCFRLDARTLAKAGHHPDCCTTVPITAMIDMVVIID